MLQKGRENFAWEQIELLARYLPDVRKSVKSYIRSVLHILRLLRQSEPLQLIFTESVKKVSEIQSKENLEEQVEDFIRVMNEVGMDIIRSRADESLTLDDINQKVIPFFAILKPLNRFLSLLAQNKPLQRVLIKAVQQQIQQGVETIDFSSLINNTQQLIIDSIQAQTHLVQADLRAPVMKEKKIKIILLAAVTQHIPKKEVPQMLTNQINTLEQNGLLHFDLRIDLSAPTTFGRTFMDTALGGKRYYTTYTMSEVHQLIAYLNNQHPGQLEVTFDETTRPHFDPNKPPFLNIKVQRISPPEAP
jgi:hypothetical protein